MTIAVDLTHRFGRFDLDVQFESAGRLTVLFGTSGSGKTSVVDLVAGLMRPDRGRIVVDGRLLVDTSARVFVPMHKRRVGYVFQDARLFPHLDVKQNLLYGRWFTPVGQRYQAFGDVVDLLGLGRLLARRTAHLSGGERQRVAIGRALLASPRLLLMDEPLAALDEARKAELLPYIERLRDETKVPILYVSHSVPEVLRLASNLVVLDAGTVVAAGEPEEIMARLDLLPAAADVSTGRVLDTSVVGHDDIFGLTMLGLAAGTLRVPRIAAAVGTPVRIRLRARDVLISLAEPEGLSALNAIAGVVVDISASGVTGADVTLDCGGSQILARITRRSVEALGLRSGMAVHAVVKTASFERGTSRREDAARFGPAVDL